MKVFKFLLVFVFTTLMVIGGLAISNNNFDVLRSSARTLYGQNTLNLVNQWINLIEEISPLPDRDKLVYVNNFFNQKISWVDDQEAWGQEDYWATPLETMAKLKGDCEDFSISKYITLILANMPNEKLRITYVKARIKKGNTTVSQAHMVLAYYPAPLAEPIILDNIVKEIVRGSKRRDLKPVFGFNTGVVSAGAGTKANSTNPANRLSRWGDALAKMKVEGICLPGEACS
ncbi:MAG: transglutaminase [Gammaproteobacteria bacterium]|jgi:predicted transglutaminase-like cysteine proteinase|nr:transglutaminase [Gammaproteobacteria bacterium]MBT5203242.1 transglutaminase [Gammaproteobacteria bacterium]MBT5602225.1 transglutaminase [Gammaproteobacteria bacterium]MBT6244505.1 transglutaminase [Gammaproteobacteria bacterium]